MRLFKKKETSSAKSVTSKTSESASTNPAPTAPPKEYLMPPGEAANTAVAEKGSYGQIAANLQSPAPDKQLLPGEQEFLEGEHLYNLSNFYEALPCYNRAIEKGYLAGYFRCWVIFDQFLPEKDEKKIGGALIGAQKLGLPWCIEEAKKNNITAKYVLACYHFYGIGDRGKDYLECVKLLKDAANAGHGFAQNLLGVCYEYGNGVTIDYREAFKWYTLSSNQAIAWGEYHLAACLVEGRKGIKKDEKKGIVFMQSAADKGLADALNHLGFCYMKGGMGVAKNYNKAAELFVVSANKGNADAMCSIGACYFNGEGVQKDKGTAIEWYHKAAAKGHATAQSNLKAIESGGSKGGGYHWYVWYNTRIV